MKKMNKKGFTIVELVIVIAVIAILSAVLIPTFSGVVADANKAAVVADAKASYQQYMADNITNDYEKNLIYVDTGKKLAVVIKDGQLVDVVLDDADKTKTSAVDTTKYANAKIAVLAFGEGATVAETAIADGKFYVVTPKAAE